MNVPVILVLMVNVKMEITATPVHVIPDILDLTVMRVRLINFIFYFLLIII